MLTMQTLLQPLQPAAEHPVLFAVCMLLSSLLGALLCALWLYRRQRLWQLNTEQTLENSIQTRTLELQFALTELAEKNKALEEQNTLDALTGVRNRAYFDKKIQAEIKRSRREQRPLSLVMLDIDHFKQINDKYGHLAGDAVIRGVAQRIQAQLKRASDQICRYGGEEFALILPNTDADGVQAFAEQIRASIAATPFDSEIGPLTANISAGCCAIVADANMLGTDYIAAADQALYQAKQSGRNQVVLHAASALLSSDEPVVVQLDVGVTRPTIDNHERDELAAMFAQSASDANDATDNGSAGSSAAEQPQFNSAPPESHPHHSASLHAVPTTQDTTPPMPMQSEAEPIKDSHREFKQ